MLIIQTIADVLNFDLRISTTPDGGKNKWDGLIEDMAGGVADIGFADVFMRKTELTEKLDFSMPYGMDRMCYMVRTVLLGRVL